MKEEQKMNFNYYGVDVTVCFEEPPRGDGCCWMEDGDSVALVYISPRLDKEQSLKTLNHELGHVWQGIKSSQLVTTINWPKTHYGASLPEEDFAEGLRVALFGLDLDRDEAILFQWVQGFSGLYETRISEEEEEAFITLCRAEVVRLLGFVPKIQNL